MSNRRQDVLTSSSGFEIWISFVIRHLSFVIRTPSFLQLQFNIISLHDYFVTLYTFESRWGQHVARVEVEFGVVPWANDLATVHFSFRQRSARMRTRVVDRVKSAGDVEHRDAIAVDLDRRGFSRWQVCRVRNFHEFGHNRMPGVLGYRVVVA